MSTGSGSTSQPTRLIASRCFKAAALLNITAIPGHHITGLISVFPALQAIPAVTEHAVGQRAATFGWDFLHSFFVVKGILYYLNCLYMRYFLTGQHAALLNYQWSKRPGPRTREERMMIWLNLLWGFFNGCRCFEKAEYGPYFAAYAPLTVLWIAPMLSVVGLLLA